MTQIKVPKLRGRLGKIKDKDENDMVSRQNFLILRRGSFFPPQLQVLLYLNKYLYS